MQDINVDVTLYKKGKRMTKDELKQLKKSNLSKEELDEISVKLKQTNY